MWVFTIYGFYSVVCARQGDGNLKNAPDVHRLMVRARDKSHLEALLQRFPKSFKGVEIVETPNSDYRFRIFVLKAAWVKVAVELTTELDYDNFKSKVRQVQDNEDMRYEGTLHRVWGTMYNMQSDKYGPGIYSPPSKSLEGYGLATDEGAAFDKPSPNDEVIVVVNQDTGTEIGVIWYPWESGYGSEAEAYADAVDYEALELVPHPEYQLVSWCSVEHDGLPVFDKMAYAGATEGEEADEEDDSGNVLTAT